MIRQRVAMIYHYFLEKNYFEAFDILVLSPNLESFFVFYWGDYHCSTKECAKILSWSGILRPRGQKKTKHIGKTSFAWLTALCCDPGVAADHWSCQRSSFVRQCMPHHPPYPHLPHCCLGTLGAGGVDTQHC